MRIAATTLFTALLATLGACQCYALCSGSVEVQLTDVPAIPYEVSIALPDQTITWTCDGEQRDEEEVGVDCESGNFGTFRNDRVDSATITIDGVAVEVDAECEKNKVCGTKCWRCAFFVDG